MPEPILSISLIAGYAAMAALSRPSSAVSREAFAIQSGASSIVERAEQSVALFGPKAGAISELSCLASECTRPNWDGYGAIPLDPRALQVAVEIIRSLPDDLLLPSFSVEPDGCISMDWMPSRNRTFTLSVGKSDRIPYAWIEGTERGHGVAKLTGGQLPHRILQEIKCICGHAIPFWAA